MRKNWGILMALLVLASPVFSAGTLTVKDALAHKNATDNIKATWGITVNNLSNEFPANEKRVFMYVAQHYPNIKLLYLDGQGDASKQVTHFETFINEKVDVLISVPQDADVLIPSYEKAIAAGIPVISWGTDINKKVGQTWITSPDVDGAEKQFAYMMTYFKDKKVANIAIMQGVLSHQAELARTEGYKTKLAEYGPKVHVVFMQTANWSRENGLKLMENWLSTGEKIDGVLCQNDEMALGALQAIKSAGLLGQIRVVGFDGIEDALNSIKNKELDATIWQDAAARAESVFQMALDVTNHLSIHDTNVPQELVTQDNVDKYIERFSFLKGLPRY